MAQMWVATWHLQNVGVGQGSNTGPLSGLILGKVGPARLLAGGTR
jgi:hypothetical protein